MIIFTFSWLEAAERLKPWNGDLSITGARTMTVLTYRGKKYTQNKEVSQVEKQVLIKYRGLDVLSKKIHDAISEEMA